MPLFQCPHCHAHTIPMWDKARSTPDKPATCPICEGASYTASSIMFNFVESVFILLGMPLTLVGVFAIGPYLAIGVFSALLVGVICVKHLLPGLTYGGAANEVGKKIGIAIKRL